MKLVIDCGSTKADLVIMHDDGVPLVNDTIAGVNVALCSPEGMADYFRSVPGIKGCRDIFFYGAGCIPGEISDSVVQAIHSISPFSRVEAQSDMLGAARALFGHEPGIACILGTGSASCLYDGSSVVGNVPSLGYVLGDEGSGNYMGRRLISDYFKGCLPESLASAFRMRYPELDVREVITKVYRAPGANAWLAQFVPFLADNIADSAAAAIVEESIDTFVIRNILPYRRHTDTADVRFVGSVAQVFESQLRDCLANYGFSLGHILPRPIGGLADYHIANK